MRSRRLLILGAGGFLGRVVARHGAGRGWSLVGVDRSPAPGGFPGEWSQLDLTTAEPRIPEGTEAVLHLAQHPAYREPNRLPEIFEVAAVSAWRWTLAAARAGCPLVLYASSGTVYRPSFQALTESSPVREEDAYTLSKLTAERGLQLTGAASTVVALRLFGLYGPGQQGMLVPLIVSRVQAGESVVLEPRPDDPCDRGGLRISFSHVEDVATALLDLMEVGDPSSIPTVLNVAAKDGASLRELAEGVARRVGCAPLFRRAEQGRRGDFVADTSLLRATVSTSFRSLEEGLDDLLGKGRSE